MLRCATSRRVKAVKMEKSVIRPVTAARMTMITASSHRAQYAAHENSATVRNPIEENSAGTRDVLGANSAGTRNLQRCQQLWREAIADPRELLELLDLGHMAATLLPAGDTGFALRVPRGF